MSEDIIECGVNLLSYKRACKLVPREFIPAYEWFLSNEGQVIPRLPRGADAPKLSVPITLASQRGMHSPDYGNLPSKGDGKKKYILSVHSTGSSRDGSSPESDSYKDEVLNRHLDGTWTIDYSCQTAMAGKRATDNSNECMMNNLIDGVPVALMLKEPDGGYRIHGLAYVEAFNSLTRMFTLHGPVSAEAKGVNFYTFDACDDITEEERQALLDADAFDDDAFARVEVVKRRHQDRFRKKVVYAYDGACAVTGTVTPSVLQAAHIDPYARSRSHAVSNGILLRADVHLLYDAHLITIRPDSRRVVVSEAVRDPMYRELDGTTARLPKQREYGPDRRLLEIHFKYFNCNQRKLGLTCA